MATEIKTIDGIKVLARIKQGWRSKPIDADRLIFIHPDYEPRVVELSSIKEGDTLPRDTDEVISFPPSLTD